MSNTSTGTKSWRYLTPKELELLQKRDDERFARAVKPFDPKAPLVILDDSDPALRNG